MGFKGSLITKVPINLLEAFFGTAKRNIQTASLKPPFFEVGPVKVEVWLGLVVGLVTQGLSDVVPKPLRKKGGGKVNLARFFADQSIKASKHY